jgi:hypothetical protein
VSGRQELSAAVGAFDDEVGLAAMPLAPHHNDRPPRQRVVRRRDPHAFDVTSTTFISVSAVVASGTSAAPRW